MATNDLLMAYQERNPISDQDELPLTESTFFILLSLAGGPRHGYAILKDVQTMSDGRVRLSTGTLYGALSRLLDQGWIERRDLTPDPDEARPRKEYILSDLGRRILNAEAARLTSLAERARLRLAGGEA